MKAIKLKGPGGLERLTVVEIDEPDAPQEGEIQVRLHASSLNYHDYLVAIGKIPTADGLIPLSDGAGIVERIGEGVSDFAVGDHVVSCFSLIGRTAKPFRPELPRYPAIAWMVTRGRRWCGRRTGSPARLRITAPQKRLL